MNAERIEAIWMEEQHLVSVDELGERWGLSRTRLRDFIAQGVLEPVDQAGPGGFRLEAIAVVRTACRLQEELELDTHAVGVVLDLLQRLRALEVELTALRARLPAQPSSDDQPPEADVISPVGP